MTADLFHMNADGVSLGAAIQSLILAKRMANRRPRYLQSLSSYLKLFARGREQLPVTNFGIDHIERWFAGRNEGMTTMASNIGRLSALFGFAERRGWIGKNPCRMLERVKIDRKPPRILTPAQAALLMRNVKPNQVPFFALAMFAGIRPEELEKVTWQSVNFDTGFILIDAAASKVRRRRLVDIDPNVALWLRRAKDEGGRLPVKRITRRRYLEHAKFILGFDTWPQDCLRHTAASYLMARERDAGLVADRLGNSPAVLLTHYRELVSKDEALAFWGITP